MTKLWWALVIVEVPGMLLMWRITADAWLKGGIAAGLVATALTGLVCALLVFILRETKP